MKRRSNTRRKRQRRQFRRRLIQFDLHKAMFVLPNLFTTSSIFCGVYAIIHVSNFPTHQQLYQASLAVFFGAFFDMADGRIARLTKTQSEFGVQLDSLADLVTFGIAPGIIVYHWAFHSMGLLGVFISFTYVASSAIRLARFNVLAAHSTELSPHFIGLPTPLAAGTLISLVMYHQRTIQGPVVAHEGVVALILILAYLMVSNVRYRNFKDLKKGKKPLIILSILTAILMVLAITYRPTFAILSFFCGYLLMGLADELVHFSRQKLGGSTNEQES
mgnify:CR=1 FL=1